MFNKNKKNLQNTKQTKPPVEKQVIATAKDDNAVQLSKDQIKKIYKANNKPRAKDEHVNDKNSENAIIEVKNVGKTYLSGNVATEVLKGVSFTINRGEVAVLFGKSGSGKSTLLNLISALDRPTSGQIIVNDVALPYLSNQKQTLFRRKHISFIFQDYNLLQNLNCYDNVETGAHLQKDKSKQVDIKQLFKDFDLEECMYKYPSQMSGGQQQRVSILRALAKNSEIIVADEPTGALDEKTSTIVQNILLDINEKYNSTIVIVSHDPDIAAIADKVIYLELGKIKEVVTKQRHRASLK